jgi:predicted nucleic acid-binding protein
VLESDQTVALVEATQIKSRYDASLFWQVLIGFVIALFSLFLIILAVILLYDFDKEAGTKNSRRKIARRLAKARKLSKVD